MTQQSKPQGQDAWFVFTDRAREPRVLSHIELTGQSSWLPLKDLSS